MELGLVPNLPSSYCCICSPSLTAGGQLEVSTAIGTSFKSHLHPVKPNAGVYSPTALAAGLILQMPKYPGLEQAEPLQRLVALPCCWSLLLLPLPWVGRGWVAGTHHPGTPSALTSTCWDSPGPGFQACKGCRGDVCSSFSCSLDGTHTETAALGSGVRLRACTSAELELSWSLALKCWLALLSWVCHLLWRTFHWISASQWCFSILSPPPAWSSGGFQGFPAHWRVCAKAACPRPRAEHPLHGSCFSLLLCLHAGWVQSAARLTDGCQPHHAVKSSSTGVRGPIWSTASSSGLPSSRKMSNYWRESSAGLRGS